MGFGVWGMGCIIRGMELRVGFKAYDLRLMNEGRWVRLWAGVTAARDAHAANAATMGPDGRGSRVRSRARIWSFRFRVQG